MCGIAGFNANNTEILSAMLKRIEHRGPDSEGRYLSDDVSLGMRRLSIIGLEDGNQPIFNEDKTIVIVFNGEIYNYAELKEQLTEKGHIFTTHTDTEVLIHAYEEHGDDFVTYLRGMFSFAIYDIIKKRLLFARDYFGIKPLYYYYRNGLFLFGSEIKSFLAHPDFVKELNTKALAHYLTFQYSVLDETFFKSVYKLKPGHRLIYEDGKITTNRYFEPDYKPEPLTLAQITADIDKTVSRSIQLHQQVSDVEVGSFLSGGIDSSYAAACFKGKKTFTVGFDYEKYNEIPYAKELSKAIGVKNHSEIITTEEYWEHLPKVQYHMDEPLADPSAVALYFVSRIASKYVKIALSGEGADELFGGYNIYREPISLRLFNFLPKPIRRFFGKTALLIPFNLKGKNFFIRGSKTLDERYIGNAYIFNPKEREKILKNTQNNIPPESITRPYFKRYKNHDDITKMQLLDINLWMTGDILLKADKMSMAHSLEVRVPYLDKEVFRTASKIPVNYRVNKKGTKYAFRQAAKAHLPDKSAMRKKLGFPVPIRIWLKDDKYFNIVKSYFTGHASKKYFHTEVLLKLLYRHKQGKADNSRKIWTIFMFLIWHEQYFDENHEN
ncbi:MAG: asparagine synthase (glutamine-hydrolyzing) [Oscillospiraceae bacterium]|nr:asparagine synthase (glutamine-hydrolyzing) [Oscillospiraceae bacterium]